MKIDPKPMVHEVVGRHRYYPTTCAAHGCAFRPRPKYIQKWEDFWALYKDRPAV